MNIFFKRSHLFVFLAAFVLISFFPKNSFAGTIGPGSGCATQSTIKYRTECSEEFGIGSCSDACCETCYDEYGSWCCGWCMNCSCSGSWTEYRAHTEGCEPVIQKRECRARVSGSCPSSCRDDSCCVSCEGWKTCEECGGWQIAERGCVVTSAGLEKPECKCEGNCIDPPPNLRYYNSPFNDVPVENSNDVYLPVKLVWDNVRGWKGGWDGGGSNIRAYGDCQSDNMHTCHSEVREAWEAENPGKPYCCGRHTSEVAECMEEKCKDLLEEMEECGACPALDDEETECYRKDEFVNFYQIEITGDLQNCEDGSDMASYKAFLESAEFFAPCHCFFKPNRTYQWRVRGCCSKNEATCGPWSQDSFKTNVAPEPISPSDPDWAGEEGKENLSYEESRELEWCKIDDPTHYYQTGDYFAPLSYKILLRYFDEATNSYVCHPLLGEKEGRCLPAYSEPEPDEYFPPDKFANWGLITRNSAYSWQVAACRDSIASDCGPYSQEWRFSTASWNIGIARSNPSNDPDRPIGLPVRLAWTSAYANSFKYKIYEGEVGACDGGSPIVEDWTKDYEIMLYYRENTEPLAILDLNTVYTWCVQPCQDFHAKDCEDDWGGPWYFKTTGQPPTLDTMKPEGTEIFIPTEFTWEQIPGAKSYWFKLDDKDPVLLHVKEPKETKIELDYPDLNPETAYSWQIKTCAQSDGQTCGAYSVPQLFKTFEWEKPSEPEPGDGDTLSDETISWQRVDGAKFYKYTFTFVELDEDEPRQEECKNEINNITDRGITRQLSIKPSLGLKCWGKYRWSIAPCLDEHCDEMGPEGSWYFYFKPDFLPPEESSGLIPCNQDYYNPSTPWDETEPCGIKHLFIILHIIIDFLFVRIVPMVLVLLVLASGVIFYFSTRMEAPSPLAKVKSLWKAAGIGIGLLLFAWIITSLLLTLFGYQLGPWHILG